jgi:hypothetical protein
MYSVWMDEHCSIDFFKMSDADAFVAVIVIVG